jgi:hypothetical protein
MAEKGGRLPASEGGRPVSAPGVGQNSKRSDLETRTVPFLHDSDLQQGDVQALEQGQRIAPAQVQQPAVQGQSPQGGNGGTAPQGTGEIPDAIDFLSGIAGGGGGVNPPSAGLAPSPNLDMWVKFARRLVNGPGSSGLLAGAYINQVRQLIRSPQNASSVLIDLNDLDDALEVALDEEANAQGN